MPSTNDCRLAPIGIFDSGIGGFSVLRHIRDRLPNESLCYFADSSFAPYGDKTEAEVLQRTLFAAQNLLEQGVKAIVVACNTATAAAITLLRSRYPDLILVGVEPGLKPAASVTQNGVIGVMATSGTLASSKYQVHCKQIQQTRQVRFINQACPGLATQIELGELESEATLKLLRNYLQPFFEAQADTIVLGCTHYPFVQSSIQRIAKGSSKQPIQLIDTGVAIAMQLQRLLEKHQLLNQNNAHPSIHFTTSGDSDYLRIAINQLLHLYCPRYTVQEISCNLPDR